MEREATPLEDAFGAVRAMILAHVPPLTLRRDSASDVEVVAGMSGAEPETFARVHRGAAVVTLELPAIDRDPNLLLKVGPALAACRGGTSDFTFTAPNARLFEDIARLLAVSVGKP